MTRNNAAGPWPPRAVLAAAILFGGTAVSSLFAQHVGNAVPHYFYSISVLSPLVGAVCYTLMIVISHRRNWHKSLVTVALARQAMKYCAGIGACFALTNLLVFYGQSGSEAGVPDVPVAVSLVLQKLVVPYSLVLESILDRGFRPLPTRWEISGVAAIMAGVAASVGGSYELEGGSGGEAGHHTGQYFFKLACLSVSSGPLALGFYIVGMARRNLPNVSGLELWAMLCIPELIFALLLTFVTQWDGQRSLDEIWLNLWGGIICVGIGRQPVNDEAYCSDATAFYWAGLPFAFAFNLAIPVLIKYKGPTSAPLFRALALPLSSLLAMANIDPVIHMPFSLDAACGVVLCTIGLVLYYGPDLAKNSLAHRAGYTTIVDEEENIGAEMK